MLRGFHESSPGRFCCLEMGIMIKKNVACPCCQIMEAERFERESTSAATHAFRADVRVCLGIFRLKFIYLYTSTSSSSVYSLLLSSASFSSRKVGNLATVALLFLCGN